MSVSTGSAETRPVALQPDSDRSMSMMDHLSELRSRVLISALSIGAGFVAGFFLSLDVIELLKRLAPAGVAFVQLTPGEVLMASVRLAFMLGVALALPVVLYQFLRFVLPALTARERGFLVGSIAAGTLLFAGGILFAYFVAIPSALMYLLEYGRQVAQTQMSINHFVAFCASLLLLNGILFELPMVLFLLSFTGLVGSAQLVREWRKAVVIIFLAAAIVTPSQDPFTMVLVGSAMLLLYLLSIVPIKLVGK